MKIDWKKSSMGGQCALLPSGERLYLTPNAFGSGKYRLRGDGKIGEFLFGKQFYSSLSEAKKAALQALNN